MKIYDFDKVYIYKRDKKECFFCKKPLELNQTTLDHYYPRSLKGTIDIFNLVISCKRCNKAKGSKIPENYKEIILELFLRAVEDNKIRGCNLKIPQRELRAELLKVDKFEAITHQFIFQSKEKRFYIKNNSVVKYIYVSTIAVEE